MKNNVFWYQHGPPQRNLLYGKPFCTQFFHLWYVFRGEEPQLNFSLYAEWSGLRHRAITYYNKVQWNIDSFCSM